MAGQPAEKIWRMSDDELAVWTLNADPDSIDHGTGFSAMRMRTSLNVPGSAREILQGVRTLNSNAEMLSGYAKGLKDATLQNATHISVLAKLAEQMVTESRQASDYTRSLADSTRNLVRATWGLAAITAVAVLGPLLVHWLQSHHP